LYEHRFDTDEGKRQDVKRQYDSIQLIKLKEHSPYLRDSSFNESLNFYDSVSALVHRIKTKVWLKNDSIFKKDTFSIQQLFPFETISIYNYRNGIALKYITFFLTPKFDTIDVFQKTASNVFTFKHNENDKKIIVGYECHKVEMTITDTITNKTIHYNLYVTTQLNLPLHIMVETDKLHYIGFPLEIEITGDEIIGLKYIIKATEITFK